jgi:cytochrome c556
METRAKPEIWSDAAGFAGKLETLAAATPALVAAAKTGNAGAIGAALGKVGKTCGGCHKPFRVPKKK